MGEGEGSEDSEEDSGNDSEDDTEDDLAEEGFTLFEGFEGGKGRKGGGSRRVKKSKKEHRVKNDNNMPERNVNNDNKLKKESEDVETMKTKDRSTFKNRGVAKSQPLKPQQVDVTDDPDQEFIDHSATLEAAYDNMEKILGSEGIKNLTNDTQSLIKQQKGLTEHMGSMLPIVTQASKMLEKFDLNALTKISNIGKKKE